MPNHPLSISYKLLLVPERCPSKEAVIESCSTCCCNSSRDVEFYDPKVPEHNTVCNVDTIANYTVSFVGTWTEGCHPDYYLDDAHWSPLTGVSHDPSYEVWNGCMYNVSLGVERVSRFGATNTIESEYTAQGSKVFDRLKGDVIFPGAGMTARNLLADANHSYVSVLTMLAPSADRMMGVSRLQLCDGSRWRRKVKVCGELFSTATASELIDRPNTIQAQNCSFGYFMFELQSQERKPDRERPRPRRPVRYREDCPPVESPPPADSCVCQPKGRSNL